MKQFIGSCVDNPFSSVEELSRIIDEAKEITQTEFLEQCVIDEQVMPMMERYPSDFTYYKNGEVYFHTHSAIEYFYN